jgi:hypothetical protein
VVFYKDRIDQVIASAKAQGLSLVLLVGNSDLDFIVEHVCRRHGLGLRQLPGVPVPAAYAAGGALFVYAEDMPMTQIPPERNTVYLSKIVLEQAAG